MLYIRGVAYPGRGAGYAVGTAGLLHRLGLLSQTDTKVFFALYSALIFADTPSFTSPTFSGLPLTLSLIDRVGYSPKFSLPMLYFVDSPKFYAANVLRYTVSRLLYLFCVTH